MLEIVRNSLNDLAKQDLEEIRANILLEDPNGFGSVNVTGQALRSLTFVPTPKGYQIVSQGSAESYIESLEKGVPPGKWPNMENIRKWVEARGIASGKEVNSAVFLIAQSIAANGTRTWINFGSRGKGSGILTSPATSQRLEQKATQLATRLGGYMQTQIKKTYGV